MTDSTVHVFGVRHHGPGSARSLLRALEVLQPDAILVEGPPEADELLPLVTRREMDPPVALLAYVPDEPLRAVFYPFAVFSPEWQAIRYGIAHGLRVRFMDLPQANWLALREPHPDSPVAVTEAPWTNWPRPPDSRMEIVGGNDWWRSASRTTTFLPLSGN